MIDLRLVFVLHDSAERHVRVLALELLRLVVRHAERRRDFLRDHVAGHGDRAVVELLPVDDHERRRLSADVEDDGAPVAAPARLERVRERDRRDVDALGREPGAFDGRSDLLDLVGLGRHDHHVLLAVLVVSEDLPVADHLVDRERDVLLDLEADHLVELVGASRGRDRREAREHHLSGDRDRHGAGLYPLLADDLEDRRREYRVRVPRVERGRKRGYAVVDEREAALAAFVFGKLDGRRADV